MSRFGELLRTGLARFDCSSTPAEARELLFQEAAQWLDILEVADSRERASFLNWAIRSPNHLEAFLVMYDIIPALREIGPDRLAQAAKGAELAVSKWDSLKSNPLVITTSAVIVAAGITWTVANEVMVKPRNQQIEQLQAQLASARKLVASSPDNTEASDRNQPKSPLGEPVDHDSVQHQRLDQQRSPPPVNEGEVESRVHR